MDVLPNFYIRHLGFSQCIKKGNGELCGLLHCNLLQLCNIRVAQLWLSFSKSMSKKGSNYKSPALVFLLIATRFSLEPKCHFHLTELRFQCRFCATPLYFEYRHSFESYSPTTHSAGADSKKKSKCNLFLQCNIICSNPRRQWGYASKNPQTQEEIIP